ncbi:MAG: hypothetical protein J2P48_20950 [Alphaproteobacteria bacterium]|nr:hypothetical protein [Alphaproteobacteria bacterium]
MCDDVVPKQPPAEELPYIDPYRDLQRAIRRAGLEMLDEADELLDALKTIADTGFNSLELQQLLLLDRRHIRQQVRGYVAQAEARLRALLAALDQAELEDSEKHPGPSVRVTRA